MISADGILKRFQQLESRRGEWEGIWQMCSDYVLPRSGAQGKTNRKIWDDTAGLALGRFAAAMESVLVPRTHKWHSLAVGIPELDQRPEAAAWLEEVRDGLFLARYAPEANFANQFTEALLSLGVHGTAVMFIDDDLGRGLRYKCIPLHEVYLAEDAVGRVDTVFRRYSLTARQAAGQFGDRLPENILAEAEDQARMDREHEFLHAVFPRRNAPAGLAGPENLPVASVHIAVQARALVRVSGYRALPYAVSRFNVTAGDVYGRSPAMEVMPSIIQLNEMTKTILRAAEKMVDPPILVPDGDVITAFNLRPGAVNFGGLDYDGRPRMVPFQINGNLPVGLEMIEDRRRVINEAFFINLFQVLVERPGDQTATEVIERATEKAQLLAPVMGRQQSELLWPIINRELDILSTAGALPPAPESLRRAGVPVNPKYETDMAQALGSQDARAILNAFASLATLAQADESVLKMVDIRQAGRRLWVSSGASARVLRSEEEMEQMDAEARAAQEQAALMQEAGALAQGLATVSAAEKNLAQAGRARGNSSEVTGNA